MLQDVQFAVLKEREYFLKILSNFKPKNHHFAHFYKKNIQIFTKLVILVAKMIYKSGHGRNAAAAAIYGAAAAHKNPNTIEVDLCLSASIWSLTKV